MRESCWPLSAHRHSLMLTVPHASSDTQPHGTLWRGSHKVGCTLDRDTRKGYLGVMRIYETEDGEPVVELEHSDLLADVRRLLEDVRTVGAQGGLWKSRRYYRAHMGQVEGKVERLLSALEEAAKWLPEDA